MKVTIIPVVIVPLGTVTKELVQGLEDLEIRERVKTIQIIALFRPVGILRRVLETCYHLDSNEKPSANAGGKTRKWVN